MLTEEPANMGRHRRTVWVALQSIRPEYPLNMREPLVLVALRACLARLCGSGEPAEHEVDHGGLDEGLG